MMTRAEIAEKIDRLAHQYSTELDLSNMRFHATAAEIGFCVLDNLTTTLGALRRVEKLHQSVTNLLSFLPNRPDDTINAALRAEALAALSATKE